LAGGIGNDVFAYTARGFGSDTIVDFQRGGDKIDLSILNIADFETLKRFISADAHGNAVITLGYGGTSEKITLTGIAPNQLAAGHFIFNTNTTNLVVEGETVYNDVLFGGRGNDQLFGYSGHDTLSGGVGNDTLNGGSGDDLLVGGAGRDVFNYTARGFGADTIADFTQGQDRINLSALNVADFASLQRFISSDAHGNAVITLGYGGSTEKITLTGVAASSLNANSFIFNTLTANLTVTGETVYSDVLFGGKGNDTLYGLSGHDTLIGRAGNDILYGDSGDDLLDGGIGADQMRGGTGNDVYFVDRAGDTIVELAGEGNDTVNTTVSLVLRNGVEVETLQTTNAAGTGAINLTGNAFAQTINGNAGANVLLGMGGDDRLNGNAGNDRLDGGAGNDSLDGGAGVDTLLGGLGNDVL
ncbi:calcium-binding protein, partial [Escherichia coli]|nr:calcium-binding protein [Escherichia coli]